MSVDAAIIRIEALAKACTGIKSTPTYPIENADPCPFAIAHLSDGQFGGGTYIKFNPNVKVDFLFNRSNLGMAYKDIDALVLEFAQRLCGDPTLNGTVEAVVFPVTFEVDPNIAWNKVDLVQVGFTVPLKTLETPTTMV